MPAVSEDQRTLFCIAAAVKKGETPRDYSPEATKLADENSQETLDEYCKAPVQKKG